MWYVKLPGFLLPAHTLAYRFHCSKGTFIYRQNPDLGKNDTGQCVFSYHLLRHEAWPNVDIVRQNSESTF
jgi:hypothetical protein